MIVAWLNPGTKPEVRTRYCLIAVAPRKQELYLRSMPAVRAAARALARSGYKSLRLFESGNGTWIPSILA